MTPPRASGSIETVELHPLTMSTLQILRRHEGVVDAGELALDHTRLNVLMRKGLAQTHGLGKWSATDRGRGVALRAKP